MRSTFASSTWNQADPNRTIYPPALSDQQSWTQRGLTEPRHSWLCTGAQSQPYFKAPWHVPPLVWSGSQTQIISIISCSMAPELFLFFQGLWLGQYRTASNITPECTQARHTGEGDTWSQLPLVRIIRLKCTGGKRRLNMALTVRKQWLLIKQSWQDWESFYRIRH